MRLRCLGGLRSLLVLRLLSLLSLVLLVRLLRILRTRRTVLLRVTTRSPVQDQLIVPLIIASLVLGLIDEIPAFDKVATQILNDNTMQAYRHIGPTHARSGLPIKLIVLPMGNVLEVKNPSIIVVLTREHRLTDVFRMHIGDRMLVRVPAPVAHIQTSHKRNASVNQTQLLVMCPVKDHILGYTVQALQGVAGQSRDPRSIQNQVLKRRCDRIAEILAIREVIRVTEHRDVGMESFQGVFCMSRRNWENSCQ